MDAYQQLGIIDYDYIEFAVGDIDKAAQLYLKWGFEKTATRENRERKLTTLLLTQRQIAILLSHSQDPADPIAQHVANHGDGVYNVAFRCKDSHLAFETTVNRGATVAEAPRSYKRDFGAVEQSSILAFGDVRHSFISRQGNLFAEGFESPVRFNQGGMGLERIDHITSNVEAGKLDEWASYYEKIFGLKNTRFFDIHTQRTGLYSKVMESSDHILKMPVNEPTEAASQIQEFIDVNHGAGVQHIAFETKDILSTLKSLKTTGVPFLDAPPTTYYEAIPKRIPTITENVGELQQLALLADGDDTGYLLQIFTQNLVGPFFYEIIQRKGNNGFGEGNFGALFEAIERDQIRRGVLKP